MFQKAVAEGIKTHILYSIMFLKLSAVYEVMWKNVLEPDELQMTMWRMRIVCWILKTTNTHL